MHRKKLKKTFNSATIFNIHSDPLGLQYRNHIYRFMQAFSKAAFLELILINLSILKNG